MSRQPTPAERKAQEAARDAFDDLPIAERYRIASAHAERAEADSLGVEAFRWRERALQSARTPAERQAAEDALVGTLDRSLGAEDIHRLSSSADPRSPATPFVRFKQARLYLHLQDWDRLETSVSDFLARFPDHRFAPDARALAERARLRGVVAAHKVGVVLPLSGKARPFGEQLLEGIKLALEGSRIELLVRDDGGDPVQAARLAEKLVFDDHVIALAGGVITQEAQALALKAQQLGVPVIAFSREAGLTSLGEYVFRNMLTNAQMTEALATYAIDARGHGRFGVLYPELPYGAELASAFRTSVEERGGRIVAEAPYAQDLTTFSEPIRSVVGSEVKGGAGYDDCMYQARKISDARRRRNAMGRCKHNLAKVVPFDALFLPDRWQTVALVSAGLAFEDVITNWCDVKDIDRIQRTTGSRVNPVMLLGANLWNHPDLPARAGKYVNCSVFVDGFWAGSTRPETAAFVETFVTRTGRNPGLLEAYGYDAGRVLRTAIETGRPEDRDQLRDTLAGLKNVPSAMGLSSVTGDRELVHPLYFLTVDQGTIRETDPTLREGPP